MFGIESNAGESIPCLFIHLPGPDEVLVGNAFVGEGAVGLAAGQDNSDQLEQVTSHCYTPWLGGWAVEVARSRPQHW
jgi:hypothetical protein